MTVRPKGSSFQADFMYEGRRYRAAFSTFKEAETWELQARLDASSGREVALPLGHAGGGSCKTIDDLVKYAMDHHWASKGRKTAAGEHVGKHPGANAALFRDWVGPKLTVREALTTPKVAEYVRHLEQRNRSGSTINRHLSAISVLVKYAMDPAIAGLERKPMTVWQREGKGRLRFFSEEEVKKLLAYLRHIDRPDDALFYEFLVDTGARFGEAERLQWQDISRDFGSATFFDTKGNGMDTVQRTVPLTGRVKAALRELKARKGNQKGPWSDVKLDSQTRLWRRLQTALPWLSDATPHHTFRHTTASWLVQRGVDLYRVRAWMGHGSSAVTERYAHLAPKHLTELVGVLEPAE